MHRKNQILEILISDRAVGRLEITEEVRPLVTILDIRFKDELERLQNTLRDAPIPYTTSAGHLYLQPDDYRYLTAVALRLITLNWQGNPVLSRLLNHDDNNA